MLIFHWVSGNQSDVLITSAVCVSVQAGQRRLHPKEEAAMRYRLSDLQTQLGTILERCIKGLGRSAMSTQPPES